MVFVLFVFDVQFCLIEMAVVCIFGMMCTCNSWYLHTVILWKTMDQHIRTLDSLICNTISEPSQSPFVFGNDPFLRMILHKSDYQN